ncbi:hypothetical protein NLG97_g631 [Lecanicillium saksenae]|uniref:Uncharacterized protein n=1 Tax=Lecanicillium saksenae TaxID=468837 RepID=A0ACC1RA55_9HYPO|nr:hypothetical protein NLG97_g631 [Lecanicillium saksenae]
MWNHLSDDEIVRRYAYIPRRPPGYKLDISKWPRMPALPQPTERRPKEMGGLPDEIIDMIVQYLDLQSFACFAYTSRRNAQIAFSSIELLNLLRYASRALAGLASLGVLGLYTIHSLHDILTSDKCVTCGGFGSFLFALEGKRCCWLCAAYNTNLWSVSYDNAIRDYGLTEKQMRGIPTASVHGKQMVSARAVVSLAVRVHGSEERVRRCFEKYQMYKHFRAYRHDDALAVGDSTLWQAIGNKCGHDQMAGFLWQWDGAVYPTLRNATYVQFPYLKTKNDKGRRIEPELDTGFWCPGCRCVAFSRVNDTESVRAKREKYLREWSRANFVKHVRSCRNMRSVIKEHGDEQFRSAMGCGDARVGTQTRPGWRLALTPVGNEADRATGHCRTA